MPLLFLHGVSVRESEESWINSIDRNANFVKFVLEGLINNANSNKIFNPYWGGERFAWNQASIPKRKDESYGSDEELLLIFLSQLEKSGIPLNEIAEDRVVLTVARQVSLEQAIALLWSATFQDRLYEELTEEEAEELSSLAKRILNYLQENSHPKWLNSDDIENDLDFLFKLQKALEQWENEQNLLTTITEAKMEAYGVEDFFKPLEKSLRKVKRVVKDPGYKIYDWAREELQRNGISPFLGDVFAYLRHRGTPNKLGTIFTETKIFEKLEEAAQLSQSEEEPLILIGHSMGGNILYDIITSFKPELKVDMLVTVGSQVGLFAEMKLFLSSQEGFPVDPKKDRLPLPQNVNHWLNVYDPDDVLGYTVEGIFSDVEDHQFITHAWLSSHTAYFSCVPFYKWLGEKIREKLKIEES